MTAKDILCGVVLIGGGFAFGFYSTQTRHSLLTRFLFGILVGFGLGTVCRWIRYW